jgi:3-ketosteroid 9alpha-monooxygenase subunit A
MARSKDYNLGEYPFPRGWFAVANSTEIGRTPHCARYFGEDVVIYRGASGRAAMLQAYCPHMGTHLGRNRTAHLVTSGRHVDGDGIRCPFHAWRFGSDGRCDDIPYFDGPIPEAARVRSWPVEERYGIVFCWNDPEGQPPDFSLPDYPEWDDPEWMRWNGLGRLADLPCHPIEIFDNTSDYAHLSYVHGGRVTRYENEIDGICYRQRESMVGESEGVGDSFHVDGEHAPRLTTMANYTGPGVFSARFLEAGAAQLIATTPIEDGSARLWQCAMVRRRPGMTDDEARQALDDFNANMVKGLGVEDAEIWSNKSPAIQIMQLPSDGPFRQARVWYSQFFNPRDKAPQILKRVAGVHGVRGVPGLGQAEATAWS